MKKIRAVLWLLVILSVIVSFWNIVPRYRVETGNRNVDIVLDDASFRDYCRLIGKDEKETLAVLKKSGVTTLSVQEDRLKELQDSGKVVCWTGAQLNGIDGFKDNTGLLSNIDISPGKTYVMVLNPDTDSQLKKYLPVTLAPGCYKELLDYRNNDFGLWELEAPDYFINETGVGFDPARIRLAKESGLCLILRPENRDNLDAEKTKAFIDAMCSDAVPSCIVFGGMKNEALGFPGGMDQLIKSIGEHKLVIGDLEVSNKSLEQRGVSMITRKMPGSVIRLISFSPLYLSKLHPEVVMDKYMLAVTDRNIRLLYFRPFLQCIDNEPIEKVNADFLEGLSSGLKNAGFSIGGAKPFSDFGPPLWMLTLVVLGISAGFALYLNEFIPDDKPGILVLCALALPAAFGLLYATGHVNGAVKVFALISGIIFSSLGLVVFRKKLLSFKDEKFLNLTGQGILILLGVTAITLTAAVHVTALLSSTGSMIAAEGLRGVKLLLVMPALLVIIAYAVKGFPEPVSFAQVMKLPVSLWHVLLVLFGALAALMVLIRSGNVSTEYRLGGEDKIRALLDKILIARPRFKEFLLGNPALILLPIAAARKRFATAWALVILGVIGQADIVDTFAHLHTPLVWSVLRTFNGVWIGIVIGVIAGAVYWKLTQERK
ncbi:MAG: DUF5693 family protein [Chloroflexi bacterium]|nr:DUF5693 family protein [Chloroflexota bacterium]